MDKVIVLSLPRTATQSTSDFLENLGYRVLHHGAKEIVNLKNHQSLTCEDVMPKFKKCIDKYDALSDMPFNIMYEYFNENYKDCKFILITRDFNDWANSIYKMYKAIKKDHFDIVDKIHFWKYLKSNPESINHCSLADLKIVYDLHINSIKQYFKDRNNFFTCDLKDVENGYKIAKFLDKTDIFSQNNLFFKNIDNVIKKKNN